MYKILAKIKPDGTFDNSFNDLDNNFLTNDKDINVICKINETEFVIGGRFSCTGSDNINGLLKLNPDGTTNSDKIFNLLGGNHSKPFLTESGKILYFDYDSDYSQNYSILRRYNIDLTEDTSFTPITFSIAGRTPEIHSFAEDSSGNYYFGGQFRFVNASTNIFLSSLNLDGTVNYDYQDIGLINDNSYPYVQKILKLSSGKAIVYGEFHNRIDFNYKNLLRLNSDGTLDTSFKCIFGNVNSYIYAVEEQPDGKLIVGGHFLIKGYKNLLRLNSDGTLDTSFTINDFDGDVTTIKYTSSGDILVGGQFSNVQSYSYNYFCKLNSAGILDTSFTDLALNGSLQFICENNSNKFILVGSFSSISSQPYTSIARLNSTLDLDTSFNPVDVNSSIFNILIEDDDSMYIVGIFNLVNSYSYNFLCKLNADGTVDTSFVNIDFSTYDDNFASDICKLSDGNYVVAAGNDIFKLNSDGSFDSTYRVKLDNIINTITELPSCIVFGGYFTNTGGFETQNLLKTDSSGNIDDSFIFKFLPDSARINCIGVQPDDNILIGGEFDEINTNPIVRLARIDTTTNSVDLSYSTPSFDYEVTLIKCFSDGKSIISGRFTTPTVGIIKLLNDGAADTSYTETITDDPISNYLRCYSTDSTGKVYVGGSFGKFSGNNYVNIARLNADWTIDTTFNPISSINSVISVSLDSSDNLYFTDENSGKLYKADTSQVLDSSFEKTFGTAIYVMVLSDDNPLVGGNIQNYASKIYTGLAKIDNNGNILDSFQIFRNDSSPTINDIKYIDSTDTLLIGGSFGPSDFLDGLTTFSFFCIANSNLKLNEFSYSDLGFNSFISQIEVLPDGKILLCGDFEYPFEYAGMVRLNSDFTIDSSFHNLAIDYASTYINKFLYDGVNEKIYICGDFAFTQDEFSDPIFNFTRLNLDGTIDYPYGSGFSIGPSFVNSIVKDQSEKILIGGSFQYQGTNSYDYFIRLNSDGSLDETLGLDYTNSLDKNVVTAIGKF